MKKLLLLLLLSSFVTKKLYNINDYSKNFETELLTWKNSFSNFSLKDFRKDGITKFSSLSKVEASFKDLEKIYKDLGSYSPNKSKFADSYSYLNLEKKDNAYQINAEVDQNVDLYYVNENKFIRLFTSGTTAEVDDVLWIGENNLIIVGTSYLEENYKKPFIKLVDLRNKKVVHFENTNKKCKLVKKYQSLKLKNIKFIE